MSSRNSSSKARWSRVDSSSQRLSRTDDSDLWKMEEELTIDPKTKQRIKFQCKISPVKQLKLSRGETMDKNSLNSIIEQYEPTKQPTCKLYLLNDQMRMTRIKPIGSGPFRGSIHYNEIKLLTVGIVHREMFAIYVEEKQGNKRSCQVYQCSTPNHVERIVQVIERINQPADSRLVQERRTQSTNSDILRSPESDVNEYPTGGGLPRLSFDANDLPEGFGDRKSIEEYLNENRAKTEQRRESQLSQQSLNVEAAVTEKTRTSSQPASIHSEALDLYNSHTNDSAPKETITVGTEFSPIQLNENNATTSGQIEWDQYVTYLEPDPIHGARITHRGPVYLFAMRIEKKSHDGLW